MRCLARLAPTVSVLLLAALGHARSAPIEFITPAEASLLMVHPGPSSLVASSRSNRQESALYATFHDLRNWTGRVNGWRIATGASSAEADGLWGSFVPPGRGVRPHSTATLMDAEDEDWPARRLLLSARIPAPSSASAEPTIGISLDEAFASGNELALDRVAHLRGDRRQESSQGGPFRDRASRHGPIVHSRLWYQPGRPASAHAIENHAGFRAERAGRPPMLYVGANDGMLHGFDASTGEERIAYVPAGLQQRLAALTDAGWPRIWSVDGSALAGDLYLGPRGSAEAARWRSYLAGFPGRGGRGYFVLDITDPSRFEAANTASLVVLDRSAEDGMDPDIGHILAEPVMEHADPGSSRQIARLNDGRWALVLGNGYNSGNERAVLLIQYLDGARELLKIPAESETGSGNGLAAPRLIDIDGNGSIDLAYAGDLHGELWKFDLRDPSAARWRPAFSGLPLFIARDASGRRQPITSAPAWKTHPEGGLMLVFGTGRLLSVADFSDTRPQSLYGIHDDSPVAGDGGKGPVLRGRDALQAQELRLLDSGATGLVSSRLVPYSGSEARRGWYLDLPLAGERLLSHPEWFEGDLADLWTTVPAAAAFAARGFRYTLDMIHGAAPRSQLHAHLPPIAGGNPSRIESRRGAVLRSDSQELRVTAPGEPPIPATRLLGTVIRRPSWRQWQ